MKFSNADVARIAYLMNQYANDQHNQGKQSLQALHYNYRNQGLTPRRFRADLRRAAVPTQEWVALLDSVPGVEDSHIDTLLRRAVALVFTREHWAAQE